MGSLVGPPRGKGDCKFQSRTFTGDGRPDDPPAYPRAQRGTSQGIGEIGAQIRRNGACGGRVMSGATPWMSLKSWRKITRSAKTIQPSAFLLEIQKATDAGIAEIVKVFSEVYYNYCDPLLDKAAQEHEYDLFFLTDIDVPWEKDDLRDSPNERESVFTVFKQTLITNNKPFITLSGDKNLRLKKATAIIDELTMAMDMGFSSRDFVQIYEHGIPVANI